MTRSKNENPKMCMISAKIYSFQPFLCLRCEEPSLSFGHLEYKNIPSNKADILSKFASLVHLPVKKYYF